MQEKNLKLLRSEIDTIDDQLLKLLIKRSLIVENIGIIKKSSDNVVDKSRESEIISRLLDLHKGNFAKDSIVRIWREIFKHQFIRTKLYNLKICFRLSIFRVK